MQRLLQIFTDVVDPVTLSKNPLSRVPIPSQPIPRLIIDGGTGVASIDFLSGPSLKVKIPAKTHTIAIEASSANRSHIGLFDFIYGGRYCEITIMHYYQLR